MNRLLLDTTFLIDSERSEESLDSLLADDDDVAIAAVTVAELHLGALASTGRRRAARDAYVNGVVSVVPVLSYDSSVAEAHAVLLAVVRKRGRPRGAHDLMIAATAKASGRILVTNDKTGFLDLPGVELRSYE